MSVPFKNTLSIRSDKTSLYDQKHKKQAQNYEKKSFRR